jgi:RNA polymerase sigma-70 factor (ECF subfamily)
MPRTWNTLSDEQLVELTRDGAFDAFAVLFERHYGRISRFVLSVGVPERDVEDVVGDVFCRALTAIPSFQRGHRYLPYLYKIARNRAIDRIRYQPMVASLDEEPERAERLAAPNSPIVEEICRQEEVAQIRLAIRQLRPADREILTLAYDRDMTSRQIMEVMGKPSISAVTTHLSNVLKRLRRIVALEEARATETQR